MEDHASESSVKSSADQEPVLIEPLPPMLSAVIAQAVKREASDIHIDGAVDAVRVRFRVDGAIQLYDRFTPEHGQRLINQIKVAAGLEVERTFAPSEGQFRWTPHGNDHARDIRVTIVPTVPRVDSVHLRLLTRPEDWISVEQLGMSGALIEQVEQVLQWPRGLVLVAGPTGAGKTTTVYALLGTRRLSDLVSVSLEDPVEFDLRSVRQVQVNERHGLTMSVGLRTLLRMDADVMVIGEIRDHESAVTAAQAALAGRLVMATIHARDAAAAIEAMHYLGVPYFTLGSALRMIISQNLVRRVCPHCARPVVPDESATQLFRDHRIPPPGTIRQPAGCEACHRSGYHGRTGVFEGAMIDDDMGNWLVNAPRQKDIRRRLADMGVRTVAEDTMHKAAAGVTSLDEARRILNQAWAGENRRPVLNP